MELIFTDGIKYVHNCTDKFDVILVDSTDPIGPAEGLFRLSFSRMPKNPGRGWHFLSPI